MLLSRMLSDLSDLEEDDFIKEAAPFGSILKRFQSASRGRKMLYGGGALAAGTALGGGMALAGARAIKTRGGWITFNSAQDREKFLSILQSQGKMPAARYALQAIMKKRATFKRKGGMGKISAATSPLGKALVEGIKSIAPQKALALGIGFAAGGAIFGLGAEVVDQTVGGLESLKRHGDKPRAFQSTVKMLHQMSSPHELASMGLASKQRGDVMRSTDAETLAEEKKEREEAHKSFKKNFDTMYRYAPLMSKDPVVSAMILKEYAGSGQVPTPPQFKQMLELEEKMHKVKSLSPFGMRLGNKDAGKFNDHMANFLIQG